MTLNLSFALRDSGVSNTSKSRDEARHRWLLIKEAFSPALVAAAIEDASHANEPLVFDPFCGSGTTTLSSSIQGISSVGIEVNPFLAFVARTKVARSRSSSLRRAADKVEAGIAKGAQSPFLDFSTFSPSCGKDKWLFNSEILNAHEGGWSEARVLPWPSRALASLALLGSALDTCNAARDGKCLRYRKNWKDRRFSKDDFVDAFRTRVDTMMDDLQSPAPSASVRIRKADSRRSRPPNFSVCVTSPPYLNSFDYTDVYRPELVLGRFVANQKELRSLRHRTIRSHVQAKWQDPTESDFGPLYEDCQKRLEERKDLLWNSRIPRMVQAYFQDMRTVLSALLTSARTESSVWLVVSTSAYAGVEIPVDLIVAEIAGRAGWHLREVGVLRHLRSSGQHWNRREEDGKSQPRLRESVVILDREPRA